MFRYLISKMEMRPEWVAGIAAVGNDIARFTCLPYWPQAVSCGRSGFPHIAVINDHQQPIVAHAAAESDPAVGGSPHGSAGNHSDIQSVMHPAPAHAEIRRDPAPHRPVKGSLQLTVDHKGILDQQLSGSGNYNLLPRLDQRRVGDFVNIGNLRQGYSVALGNLPKILARATL